MKKTKKLFSLLLVLCMVLSLAACGGSDNNATTGTKGTSDAGETEADAGDDTAKDEVITLTIWNTEVLSPGIQTNDVAKYIEEKLGIKMDIIQGDAQKFSLLVAGGDLPDIIYTNPAQQGVNSNALITSGQIIALDDLIEQYGENIKQNFPSRLDFSKRFCSNGEDKTYFLPVLAYESDSENPDISQWIANVGLLTRFDVYQAIGCPEITTTDDYLNVLKQMQDYARENDLADGKQIYAISGWNDWGVWPWWLANTRESGYDDLANLMILNRDTDQIEGLYDSDVFWESLAFYNKAYNMGILDPEAFTMKNDQFWEKCTNGQVLMCYASWQSQWLNLSMASRGNPEWSFQKLPFDGYEYISGIITQDAPLGSGIDYANAITTNCKYPERAMQLLDFLNSEEGARLVYSGIEGVHWETVDGVAKPTQAYLTMIAEDPDYREKTGVTMYNKYCGFRDIQVLSDNTPADIMKSNEQKAATNTQMDTAYCEYYESVYGGTYEFPGQVLYDLWQKGEVKTSTEYILYPTLVQQPSDEALSIIAQCDQYMGVQAVKAIMAANQAEFDAARAEAMESLKNKNYQTANDEIIGLYEQAKEEVSTFEIK